MVSTDDSLTRRDEAHFDHRQRKRHHVHQVAFAVVDQQVVASHHGPASRRNDRMLCALHHRCDMVVIALCDVYQWIEEIPNSTTVEATYEKESVRDAQAADSQ